MRSFLLDVLITVFVCDTECYDAARTGFLDASAGQTIRQVIEKLVYSAGRGRREVSTEFNGITLTATPTTTEEELYGRWRAHFKRP